MSDTPITDAAEFSATCEKPESGEYELRVVYSDETRKLERKNHFLRDTLRYYAAAPWAAVGGVLWYNYDFAKRANDALENTSEVDGSNDTVLLNWILNNGYSLELPSGRINLSKESARAEIEAARKATL